MSFPACRWKWLGVVSASCHYMILHRQISVQKAVLFSANDLCSGYGCINVDVWNFRFDLIITEVAFHTKMTQGDAARRFAASNPGVVNTADLNLQILGFSFRQRFWNFTPKIFRFQSCLNPQSWSAFKNVMLDGRRVACDRNFWSLVTEIFGRLWPQELLRCHFSWQAQYLVMLECHFSWQAHCLVMLEWQFLWQVQHSAG